MIDPEIAAELFGKAHEIERENWFYLTGLGAAHYRAGQWEEAITTLTKSAELTGGENSLNFLLLFMTHWQSGNKDAAANWYKKAIEWMQKSDIDITSAQRRTFQSLYLEASELMGIKVEEFDRKD
jgi:tetratricopeptide (TPR) repeat protein